MSEVASRKIQQVPRFKKAKRRLPDPTQQAVDEQVRTLLQEPLLGELKTGVLKGVRVVKFKEGAHQYLLAYQFLSKSNVIIMLDVGVHENFYRDLEHYLKAR